MKCTISSQLSGEIVYDLSAENVLMLMGMAAKMAERPEVDAQPKEKHIRVFIDDLIPKVHDLETPEAANPTFTGFLLLRCEHCGNLRGFCSRTPLTEYRCRCGGVTKLDDLRPATLMCRSCGGTFRYKTNMTVNTFAYNCLDCGKRNRLRLNSDGTAYITDL